jgi:hypothetical protein
MESKEELCLFLYNPHKLCTSNTEIVKLANIILEEKHGYIKLSCTEEAQENIKEISITLVEPPSTSIVLPVLTIEQQRIPITSNSSKRIKITPKYTPTFTIHRALMSTRNCCYGQIASGRLFLFTQHNFNTE